MANNKRPLAKISLISSSEIAEHIGTVANARKEHERHMHQVAVSCLFIAAKDGQISPLNRFNIVIAMPAQLALKAYAFQHCRSWLTMDKGEYRVKPGSEGGRHDFLQIAETLLAGHPFLEREPTPKQEPKPLDETRVLKAVQRITKQVKLALEKGNKDLTTDFANVLEHFQQRLARLVEIHGKPIRGRGRPRKVIELEHARGRRPAAHSAPPKAGARKTDTSRPAAH